MKNIGHRYWFKIYASFLVITFLVACTSEKNSLKEKVWIPGWQKAQDMTIARAGAAVVAHENRIYIIGGVDGVNFLSTVEMAEVQADGSLSKWQLVSEMPESRGFISASVHKNRVYVVGGGNGSYGKNLLNSVVSAALLENGKLGEWREEKQKMLVPRRCSKTFTDGERLYALGGFSGALLDTVEVASFSDNGELGEWQILEDRMTIPRYVNEAKVIGNRIFAIGGHHQSKGIGIKQVEFANYDEWPMKWQQTSSMQQGRYAFGSAAYRNTLYAMGGISGSEYLNTIEKLQVDGNVVSKSWQMSTKLPAFMANFTTILIGDRIYLLGGSTRHKYLASVWFAEVNNQGDLGYWGSKQQLEEFKQSSKKPKTEAVLPNSGIVLQVTETESYNYLLVNKSGEEVWLAAPKVTIKPGDHIRFSEGVYMSNFYSKALQRRFNAIIFVGTIELFEN